MVRFWLTKLLVLRRSGKVLGSVLQKEITPQHWRESYQSCKQKRMTGETLSPVRPKLAKV